ncbi:MAG: pilus assembly protein PilM [Nitrospirae bacterium]|nr:pilus assembly protein PilM [Nitrospirota bacterium]
MFLRQGIEYIRKLGAIRPRRSKYSPIGLDVGAASIRMAQLKRTLKGWVIGEMIAKDIPASNNENGAGRKDATIQAIKDIMKESSFSGRSVVSVMPGYQMDSFPVKLSLTGDEAVEEAVIREARAHLSYSAENAVVDYLLVNNVESGPRKGKSAWAILLAARREDVDEHLSILREAGLKPVAIDISACALARVITFSRECRERNALIINIGQMHTTLTLLQGDNILLDRNILWGRENMIESLMNKLKLNREGASRLVDRVGLHTGQETWPDKDICDRTGKISETFYEILAPTLEKLARELDKVFQYFASEMRGATIDDIYLTGEGSSIRDMDSYLENRTGTSTKHFDPLSILKEIKNEVPKDDDYRGAFYSVALGLAMRGLENRDTAN